MNSLTSSTGKWFAVIMLMISAFCFGRFVSFVFTRRPILLACVVSLSFLACVRVFHAEDNEEELCYDN